MRFTLLFLTCCFISPAFGTAKTLPHRLWSFSAYQETSSVQKIGVNPANDEVTWISKDLKTAVLGDLPNFQALAPIPGIDLNTRLAKYWEVNRFHFDVAYGLTDHLTAFANILYDSSRIRFTDEFVSQMAIANVGTGGQVPFSPIYMKAYHLGDTFVGLKYQVADCLAFTARATFGPFKTGRDDHASREIDYVKEIPTGTVYDQYEFYSHYDQTIGKIPFRLMLGYIYKNRGYQNFFDNRDITMNMGDLFLAGLGADYAISKKWDTRIDFTFIHSNPDQVRENGTWRSFPESKANTVIGKVGATYSPYPFLQIFTDAFIPLSNDLTGKLYDSPGRLEPGWNFQYGVRLFYM